MLKLIISKIILFSFFAIFFCNTAYSMQEGANKKTLARSASPECWIISEDIENIKAEEIVKVLKAFDISAEIKSFREYYEQYKILKGKYFTIYLAPRFYHRDQVWILQNHGSETPFEDLNQAQLQELESFRYLVGEIFQRYMNYQGYVMFMDFEKDYGLGRFALCLEMIPAKAEDSHNGEVNLLEKIGRANYVFFGDRNTNYLTPEEAKSKIEHFKTYLIKLDAGKHTINNQRRVIKNTLPWERKISHLEELSKLCLQNLKQDLMDQNKLYVSSSKASHPSQKSEMKNVNQEDGEFTAAFKKSIDIKNCVFCNSENIKAQSIYEFGDFICLYNIRPYTPHYHFMVTPALFHIENWQNFSLNDTLQMDHFAQAVVKALKLESGREDIIMFAQNGLAGGMTVPHSHLHILPRPLKRYLTLLTLLEITGQRRKGPTPEEMVPIKAKMRMRLEQLLLPSSDSSTSKWVH